MKCEALCFRYGYERKLKHIKRKKGEHAFLAEIIVDKFVLLSLLLRNRYFKKKEFLHEKNI